MKGRCPDSLFVGLARLDNWKWHINSTQYANIVPSPGDVVYGSLFFLSPRDEAGLDESEGVPWLYEKKSASLLSNNNLCLRTLAYWADVSVRYLTCTRISPDGSEISPDPVPCMTYVDVQRQDDGVIMPDYIIWITKAIREALPLGLPQSYIDKYIRPWIPTTYDESNEQEIQMVRVTSPRNATMPASMREMVSNGLSPPQMQ